MAYCNMDELRKIKLLSVIILTEQSSHRYVTILMMKILSEINRTNHVKQN